MKRGVYIFLGSLFIIIGLIYIFHSFHPITGWFIVDHIASTQASLSGFFFLFIGMHFLALTRKKKGQAAMEFLMTYGWAILASITALSMLAYFGVFGGGTLFGGPSKAILSTPFTSEGTSINLDYIQVQVRNSASYSITITGATLTDLPTGVTCDFDPAASGSLSLSSGATTTLVFECTGLQEGQQINANIDLTYTKQGSSLSQSSSGTISGKVPNTSVCPAGQHLENGVCVPDGGGFGDGIPPIITITNVNGDTTQPYVIGPSTSVIVDFNTDEAANCRWANDVDLGYTQMTDSCTGAGGISHSCITNINSHDPVRIYLACTDLLEPPTAHQSDDNSLASIDRDFEAPVQSNWNPPGGSPVTSPFTLTFDLDEGGDCRFSTSEDDGDVGYDNASGDCIGDGTQSISCEDISYIPKGGEALLTVYLSCQDEFGNKDTTVSNTELTFDAG